MSGPVPITPAKKAAKKPPPPKELVSFVTPGGIMGESTFDPARTPALQFAVWDGRGWRMTKSFPGASGAIVPAPDPNHLLARGVVLLASAPAAYGSQSELIASLLVFIHLYADVPPFWEELLAHYALMSWLFDKFSAVPYLRFLGEPGDGKTRLAQIAAHLCMRAIFAGGATSAPPIFRLMDRYHGTFFIDEADYKTSNLWSEIIKILNCGYARGGPILRCTGDNYEIQAFDAFGPKILTTRREFEDHALETRCLTLRTTGEKLDSRIPRALPDCFFAEALELRNKLLLWRFHNYSRIVPDESGLISLEPRLTQIATPVYSVSCDPGFRGRLLAFLRDQAEDQQRDRPLVIVVEAIRRKVAGATVWPQVLSIKEIAGDSASIAADWGSEIPFTPKRTGGLLRGLGFAPRRTMTGYQFEVSSGKLATLNARYPPPAGGTP